MAVRLPQDRPAGFGIVNTNDVTCKSPNDILFVRFVLPRTEALHSFIHNMRFAGASWTGVSGGYARGNGGTHRFRLCNMDASTGLPLTATPLAQEDVAAQTLWTRSQARYGQPPNGSWIGFMYFLCGGVTLQAGVPYCAVFTQVHPQATSNWSCFEMATAPIGLTVAQDGNNFSETPPAAVSIAGLDHREVVGWKRGDMSSYVFGRYAGGPGTAYQGNSYYDGSGGAGIRLPQYGWETTGGARHGGQPYVPYPQVASGGATSTTYMNALRAVTVTQVRAYVYPGQSAGTVTFTNITTGVSKGVVPAGSGDVVGTLPTGGVAVAVGDDYRISASGQVGHAKADGFAASTFGLGNPNGDFPFTSTGGGVTPNGVGCFGATPWPHHSASGAPPPPPPPSEDRALSKTATASSVTGAGGGPYTADRAVDGNAGTRWASFESQPQWWKVDLGANYQVNQVDINWESAYATSYKIMTSLDNVTFTQAAAVTATSSGPRSTAFAAVTARYVRIDCETRATIYGFSFWSVEVFGLAATGLFWYDDFERTTILGTKWGSIEEPTGTGHQAQTSTTHARDGAKSARFELRDDELVADHSRMQLTDMKNDDGTLFRPSEGDEFYQAISMWFEDPFPGQEGSFAWNVFFAWTSFDARGSGPLKISHGPNGYLSIEGVDEDDPPGGYYWVNDAATATGGWHDMVLHIKFSQNPGIGFLELWHKAPSDSDYVQQTFIGGGTKRYFATLLDTEAYAKLGMYRAVQFTQTALMFTDRVKLGTTFESVSATGSGDTTAPDTYLLTAPPSSGSTSAQFVFSSSEQGSTFEAKLDAGAYAAVSSPLTLTGLSVASHTLLIRAIDPAGNVDPAPASHTWTVTGDTTAPTTTLDQVTIDPSQIGEAGFEFSANEDSTFEWRIDGGPWTLIPGPAGLTATVAVSGLADGSHTFDVRATDEAGNVDATPATHTWEIISELSSGATNWAENEVGDWLTGRKALTQLTIECVLFTSAPTDAGGGTEPTTGGYAPVATIPSVWSTTSPKTNVSVISFPTPTAQYDVVATGVRDTVSGNLVGWKPLAGTVTAQVGDPLRFGPGQFTITVT